MFHPVSPFVVLVVPVSDEQADERVGSGLTPGPRSKTYTVPPCRVLDTRFSSPPGPIGGAVARDVRIVGSLAGSAQGGAADCGVRSGATGVFINVVAVGAGGTGHLTIYPAGSALPLASTLNFSTGDTVANGVLVPVCFPFASCAADLTIQMGPAAAHVVIDVTGYIAPSMIVHEGPAFTSGTTATFHVGVAGTFTVTTTGFPPPVLSETGGLPGGVTFTDNGNGTATLGGIPSPGSAGTYPLTLTADNGIGAPPTQSFTLTVDSGTSTVVNSSVNPSVSGQSVTFTATVSPLPAGPGTLTGTVTFVDGATPLGPATLAGGVATFTTTSLSVGPHSITAVYGGDPSFTGSTSAPLSQMVNRAGTGIGVTSSVNPSAFGQGVTFTATVSATPPGAGTPTGTVTFAVDGMPQAPVGLAGNQAQFSTAALAVGAHSVGATYDGDGHFNASTSTLPTQTVNAVSACAGGTPVAAPSATAATGQSISPLPAGYAVALLVQSLDTVTLHGHVTGVTTASYEWRLLSAPVGNTAGLSGAPGGSPTDISRASDPSLFAQLAGDYVVGVTAISTTGCRSAEVKGLVRVQPVASLAVQLTWDQSVDLDLQLDSGTQAFTITGSPNACYWGNRSTTWGANLDIDDLAGCNPEVITLNPPPPTGSAYSVRVHYYCNRRGHLATTGFVCYEPVVVSTPVNVTVKIFGNGVLAAVFTAALVNGQVWTPATVVFETGVWMVMPSGTLQTVVGCAANSGESTCVCSNPGISPNDPYCGAPGAACRQRYP